MRNKLLTALIAGALIVAPCWVTAGINDRFSPIDLGEDGYIIFPEISAPTGNPLSGKGWVYVLSGALYFEDSDGTTTDLTLAGSTAFDDIGDPDANTSITFAGYTTTFTSTLDTGSFLKIDNTDADLSGDTILIDLEFTDDGDANGIFVKAKDNNGDAVFTIGANGATTIAGSASGTDAITVTAGDMTLTSGDLTLASGDVDVTGGVTSDTLRIDGVLTLENGATIDNASNNIIEFNENNEELKVQFGSNTIDLSSSTGITDIHFFDNVLSDLSKQTDSAGDDFVIRVTGSTNSSLLLQSSGTGADAISLTASAGGIDITSSGAGAGEDIDITTDASVNITSTEDAASAVKVVTNGGTSETMVFTNTQGTGDAAIDVNATAGGIDVDAAKSITLTSAENTADSIVLSSTVGGIDITAAGAGAGEDIDITATGSSVNITATEDAASAVKVVTNGGTSETMVFTNTQGTGDASIDIDATAGGIDVDAAKSVTLTSTENTADSIVISSTNGGVDITAAGAAAGEDIDISSTGSSVNVSATEDVADAVVVNATTGGIDITADGDPGKDLDLTNTNGSVNITAGEAAADAVVVSSTGGVDITSAATFDIDITATGGTIKAVATEAAADQFKVDAQGTIAGYAINLETTDGAIFLNADGASNGDITIDAADDAALTAGGAATVQAATGALNLTATAGNLNLTAGANLTLGVTGTLSGGSSNFTDIRSDYENVTATNVIAATECGKVFFLGSATEFDSDLPPAANVAGCVLEFYITSAPSGASYTVTTDSLENTIIGGVVEREVDQGDDGPYLTAADTVTFVDSLSVVGDTVRFVSNGTNWYMTGVVNADGGLTITQAD